ncbi:phosphate acyltransferase PlsX [bacterium]|nr:MAG: phosphate acyltransferase PlsX [bacterium]QQR61544.1 MAG: phosphate acyltransferase PlsX [bacterium]
MPKIAVDAMGGDYAPIAVVKGAVAAARKGVKVTLFGDHDRVAELLSDECSDWQLRLPITVEHCFDVVDMAEVAIKKMLIRKASSMACAIDAVKMGRLDAFVSAGNSAAVHAFAMFQLGRINAVLRPALAGFFPTLSGAQVFCLDLGANTDCKADYLVQFAQMGSIYVQHATGVKNPRVALVSNGHEPYKGCSTVKKAYEVLSCMRDINFIGNVEARDIFQGGVDVLVCDGFIGNVMLKTAQGTVNMMMQMLKKYAEQSLFDRFLLACSGPLLQKLKSSVDYVHAGGALLLGVKKPVIIAHGSSNAQAIENAILLAERTVKDGVIANINNAIQDCLTKNPLSVGSNLNFVDKGLL